MEGYLNGADSRASLINHSHRWSDHGLHCCRLHPAHHHNTYPTSISRTIKMALCPNSVTLKAAAGQLCKVSFEKPQGHDPCS